MVLWTQQELIEIRNASGKQERDLRTYSLSKLQSQDTSDIPIDGSFSSDLEVKPINEPNKRSHKRVVKTDGELFLPTELFYTKVSCSCKKN